MKTKLLIFFLLGIIKIHSQENLPYNEGDLDKKISTYSDTPPNSPNIPLYKPNYDNSRTREYVDNLQSKYNNEPQKSGTLEKIIDTPKDKIDISGGYVRAKDGFIEKSDGTLIPKNKVYVQDVNDSQNVNQISHANSKELVNMQSSENNISDIFIALPILGIIIFYFMYLILKRKHTGKK